MKENMKINLMTWNTRMYEYENKINGFVLPIDDNYFDGVINVILEHLKKDNSIVILQEIPYVSNITWQEHELFSKFIKIFENDYYVKYNISSKRQIMMTVVISQNKLIEYDEKGFNDNRSISFKLKDTETYFLGLHAKNKTLTASYLDNVRRQYPYYDYILGDFNSGNYNKKVEDLEFKKNRTAYCEYLKKYIDICDGKPTTKYGTSIDHILSLNNNPLAIIDDKIHFSDHYPIYAEIEI